MVTKPKITRARKKRRVLASEQEMHRLKRYLECEALLRELFNSVGYCNEICAPNSSADYDANVGCCIIYMGDYDPKRATVLEKERVRLYGLPDKENINEGRCGYHTLETGCRLNDHRPPLCVAYACNTLKQYLGRTYQIKNYSWSQIHRDLDYILFEDADSNVFCRLKLRTEKMIGKVKPQKSL